MPTSFGEKLGLTRAEIAALAPLKTPEKIQDFMDGLRINPEYEGDTCLSVRGVLKHRHAHCIESAFVAACALWMHGQKPLLMDLKAQDDYDHVVALFRHRGHWGAISKSNHVWLRWRDPIYKSLRELAMSYFHEYTSAEKKTLRSYSLPMDMRRHDPETWVTNTDYCWDVALSLDGIRHYPLVTPTQARRLRPRDEFEVKANKMKQFKI